MCRPAGSFAVFVGSNQSLCTNRGRRYRLSRRKSTPRRISGRMWDNLRLFELFWGDTHNVMGHGLSTAEDTCRHRSGCDRFVRVMNIIDVRYVRNIGYVPHVSYVDDIQINTAVVVPGKKRIPRPQWEPTNLADANAYREMRASQKRYQGRHINRHYDQGWRYPIPSRSDINPAAVVEGTKSPFFIFNPGLAPGINPYPMPEAIWHPTRRNNRIPDGAVVDDLHPMPVSVQVVTTGSQRTDILRGA